MKSSIYHYYTEKDIKKEYKFWDTQLVPKFSENISNKLGPIKNEIKEEDIPKQPEELPEKDMEWVLIDINKEGELEKIYNFLIKNYYEDKDFIEQYSLDFLKWQFSPIENNPHKNILLSIQKNGKIIAFFSGLPLKLSVYGKTILTYNISFLCIDINYRNKRLAEYMFKEMFRRTYLEKVFQNIFVSKLLIPRPFAECTYYYAEVKSTIKKFKINKKKFFNKFRLMEKKDVKGVCKLISNSQKKFKIYSIFSEEEIEHLFIPIKDVIYSFVKEDKNNIITDFTSFYVINAKIDGINEKWCYIYFNIATSITSEKLFENSLILAEQCGIDYYIGNSINNYENILKKYKFNSNLEDGDLSENHKYYFHNFICPETVCKDISLILI